MPKFKTCRKCPRGEITWKANKNYSTIYINYFSHRFTARGRLLRSRPEWETNFNQWKFPFFCWTRGRRWERIFQYFNLKLRTTQKIEMWTLKIHLLMFFFALIARSGGAHLRVASSTNKFFNIQIFIGEILIEVNKQRSREKRDMKMKTVFWHINRRALRGNTTGRARGNQKKSRCATRTHSIDPRVTSAQLLRIFGWRGYLNYKIFNGQKSCSSLPGLKETNSLS